MPFMQQYPYRIRTKAKGLNEVLQVIAVGPYDPPEDWPFLIGDTLHNMRVALDYLAYHVVTKHSTTADKRKIAFPIFDNPDDFAETTRLTLRGIPSDVSDAFEGLQPYAGINRPGSEFLLLLAEFENVHKHRHMLAAYPGLTSIVFNVLNDPDGTVSIHGVALPQGPLVDDTVVARMSFSEPVNREAKVDSRATFHVVFDKTVSGRGLNALKTLKDTRNHIRDVVFPAFRNFV